MDNRLNYKRYTSVERVRGTWRAMLVIGPQRFCVAAVDDPATAIWYTEQVEMALARVHGASRREKRIRAALMAALARGRFLMAGLMVGFMVGLMAALARQDERSGFFRGWGRR